jgi:hypothetical protein
MLERNSEPVWLDITAKGEQLDNLLKPYPSSLLAAHTIGDLINRKVPERNSPELIKPVDRPSGNTLF